MTTFQTEKRVFIEGNRNYDWQPVETGFETEDQARMAFADSRKYPMDTKYRVVKVTKEVVFE